MSIESVSITHHAQACNYLFQASSSNLQTTGISYQQFIDRQEFLDESGRYNLWLQASGALKVGRQSLDHRLAESSYISRPVLSLIKDLRQALEEVLAIVSDKRPQRIYVVHKLITDANVDESSISSESTDSESGAQSPPSVHPGPTTELDQLFLAIKETITSLFRLSYLVQNPRPRDRYTQNASTTSLSESYDIDHVWNQYPYVRSTSWLLYRLGKANARRRQFFRIAEAHREKMAQVQGSRIEIEDEADVTQLSTESTTAFTQNPSTLFSNSQMTTNSAISFDNNNDYNDDDVRSQTSYGTSVNLEGKMSNRIPPPPRESMNRRPFECKYCYQIITVRTPGSWRKHVCGDLLPYICTFEDCSLKMFSERHTWFEHELNFHRREWSCFMCSYSSTLEASFESHLSMCHHDLYTEPQLPFLMVKCESSIRTISANACPFCNEDWAGPSPDELSQSAVDSAEDANMVSLGQFRSHVGRHMEDLALFVLPQRYDSENSVSSSSENSDADDDSDADTKVLVASKRDHLGRTSLARACAAQRVDEVWRLIAEFPQELDTADYAGNTPLQLACCNGSIEIVQALIDSGCGIKCRNKVWNTPLMEATMHGHSSVVFRLVAANVSINEHNADGKRAIDMLDATVADYEIIKTALTYAGIDSAEIEISPAEQLVHNGWESDETDTPLARQLIVAVGTGSLDEAEKLLKRGVSPDAKHFRDTRMKMRALDVAAIYKHATLIPLLIRYGANIALVNPATPIILVGNSIVDPLRLLLENGLDINVPCLDCKPTALSCAAAGGLVDIVRLLLAFGADPNKEIPMLPMWPPALPALHNAAGIGNEEIVTLLLASGADIQLKCCFGSTALHIAASSNECQMIRLLVRHGADLEAVDTGRETPLLRAIKQHKEDACKLLVELGASMDANAEEKTLGALAFAAQQGHLPILQYLVDKVTDIDVCDIGLGTPLHHAAALQLPGNIQLLLQRGANTFIKNVRGKTALDFVVEAKREDLAELWFTYAVDRRGTSAKAPDTAES